MSLRNTIQIEVERQRPKYYIPTYRDAPLEEIMIDEFEELCRDRLTLLRALEDYSTSITEGPINLDDQVTFIKENKLYHGGMNSTNILNVPEIRRDEISHYLLRLAFCQSEENKRWLVDQEMKLFKLRLKNAQRMAKDDDQAILNILEDNYRGVSKDHKFSLELVKEHEWNTIKKLAGDYFDDEPVNASFYKVHYKKALRELRAKKRFVHAGFIYLSTREAVYTYTNLFKRELEEALDLCSKFFEEIITHFENIGSLLRSLPNMQTTKTYTDHNKVAKGKIRLGDIDALSTRSFPLCMSELHAHVRKEHHLKHVGRMQYALFLKGIGLSLDDSLTFFKNEFTKKMPEQKFNKDYAYNIRHNYGKEGKRADYTPWNCAKIILSNPPGANEQHGCPYKHYSDARLEAILRMKLKIPNENIREILDKKRGGHVQIACKRLFETLHPKSAFQDNVGTHPNAYFEASQKYLEEAEKNKKSVTQNSTQSQM